jgi:hypothetical protein
VINEAAMRSKYASPDTFKEEEFNDAMQQKLKDAEAVQTEYDSQALELAQDYWIE